MARSNRSTRVHDVGPSQSLDKIYLGLAFVIGVAGGVFLKIINVHPFVAAGFAAGILVVYAILTFQTTTQRLEPEVIGDNAYYLGFLFTLTSLSVTLYFVVEAEASQRAELIPEVISGFGVALVSTIMGVFIRVMMMQFRVDIVAREKETRIELDDTIRKFRTELGQSTQRLKTFTVESLQQSAEREAGFQRATDELMQNAQQALTTTVQDFHAEAAKFHRDQLGVTLDTMRTAMKNASEAALAQMKTSFAEMGQMAVEMRTSNEIARNAVEQANANLQLRVGEISDQASALARRIRTTTESVESAGTSLTNGVKALSTQLHTTFSAYARQMDEGMQRFESNALQNTDRTGQVLDAMVADLTAHAASLSEAASQTRNALDQTKKILAETAAAVPVDQADAHLMR